ncbi:UNVERIFIED_CONTAM: hypothetical protein Sangu_2623000 [Sesamum angustifolium]|uniref:Uncharacterized protein n=1 Tax=Sesamum angustifolium TaxID=2727405 RepID=A0AAW2J644_9LAMI
MPPTTSTVGCSPSTLVQTPPLPRVVSLTADPPHLNNNSDTSTEELSTALFGVVQ